MSFKIIMLFLILQKYCLLMYPNTPFTFFFWKQKYMYQKEHPNNALVFLYSVISLISLYFSTIAYPIFHLFKLINKKELLISFNQHSKTSIWKNRAQYPQHQLHSRKNNSLFNNGIEINIKFPFLLRERNKLSERNKADIFYQITT